MDFENSDVAVEHFEWSGQYWSSCAAYSVWVSVFAVSGYERSELVDVIAILQSFFSAMLPSLFPSLNHLPFGICSIWMIRWTTSIIYGSLVLHVSIFRILSMFSFKTLIFLEFDIYFCFATKNMKGQFRPSDFNFGNGGFYRINLKHWASEEKRRQRKGREEKKKKGKRREGKGREEKRLFIVSQRWFLSLTQIL